MTVVVSRRVYGRRKEASMMLVFAILVYAVILISGVGAHEVSLRCNPNKSSNFSSQNATVVIYNIENDTKDTQDDSFFCAIANETDQFVKMEFDNFLGEPPKFLTLEVDNSTLFNLKNSLILCHARDIKNRMPLKESWKIFHQTNNDGNMTYQCPDETLVNIDGLIMLKEDFSDRSRAMRDVEKFKEILVTVGKVDGDHENLGKRCDCEFRICYYMYDESGKFVCGRCSTGSFWNSRIKSCSKCGNCAWNEHPNVRTSCMASPCRSSTITTLPSTTLATTTTATPTTPEPVMSTIETIVPPAPTVGQHRFLKNWTLKARHDTSMLLQWNKTSGSYMVQLQSNKDDFFVDTLKETRVEITGLIQRDFDKTASIIVNSTGSSSWIFVRILGTAPKESPVDVETVKDGSVVTLSWNGYAETSADGVQVEVLLGNKTDGVYKIENKIIFKRICLLVEGNYTFHVRYYNSIGFGPVVTRYVEFRFKESKQCEAGTLFTVLYIMGLILCFVLVPVIIIIKEIRTPGFCSKIGDCITSLKHDYQRGRGP